MAEIHLTAMYHEHGGPDLPQPIAAYLRDEPWPGGGTVKVLYLNVGQDALRIWPADPEIIAELAEKLAAIAKELTVATVGRETVNVQ